MVLSDLGSSFLEAFLDVGLFACCWCRCRSRGVVAGFVLGTAKVILSLCSNASSGDFYAGGYRYFKRLHQI